MFSAGGTRFQALATPTDAFAVGGGEVRSRSPGLRDEARVTRLVDGPHVATGRHVYERQTPSGEQRMTEMRYTRSQRIARGACARDAPPTPRCLERGQPYNPPVFGTRHRPLIGIRDDEIRPLLTDANPWWRLAVSPGVPFFLRGFPLVVRGFRRWLPRPVPLQLAWVKSGRGPLGCGTRRGLPV